MNNEEIINRIESIEKRLNIIESKNIKEKVVKDKKENFEGLAGGIRLLIKNKFLNELKSLNEIESELKREGYHYSVKSISKALLVDFMKNWKLITRSKENKLWKYIVRK